MRYKLACYFNGPLLAAIRDAHVALRDYIRALSAAAAAGADVKAFLPQATAANTSDSSAVSLSFSVSATSSGALEPLHAARSRLVNALASVLLHACVGRWLAFDA